MEGYIVNNIERPRRIECVENSEDGNYGRFVIEPLERGYGITLGNSLRRVMLSSLPGAAVKSIHIDGVRHEFSTIPGVVEDVTQIVLNIKKVAFKLFEGATCKVTIDTSKAGEVTAADIVCGAEVTVLNKDQHIATLNGESRLSIEMEVAMGIGWSSSDKNKSADQPNGVISIDSIFSPVKKVNFVVENTLVGNVTDYDKLSIEVWTDGSISPEEALKQGAQILIEQLSIFVNESDSDAELQEAAQEESASNQEKVLEMSIEELDLSVRSSNCLKRAAIHTVGDLVKKTEDEMMKVRNLGKKSFVEIQHKLEGMGLSFKDSNN